MTSLPLYQLILLPLYQPTFLLLNQSVPFILGEYLMSHAKNENGDRGTVNGTKLAKRRFLRSQFSESHFLSVKINHMIS
jgi:hypothetical protein